MGAQAHQKRDFAVPPKQNPKVSVDAEGPVIGDIALELVSAQQGVPRIDRESAKGGS